MDTAIVTNTVEYAKRKDVGTACNPEGDVSDMEEVSVVRLCIAANRFNGMVSVLLMVNSNFARLSNVSAVVELEVDALPTISLEQTSIRPNRRISMTNPKAPHRRSCAPALF